MKTIITTLAVALMTIATPANAEPLAYPGSAWGTITNTGSMLKDNPERGDWIYTGKITQGVDWVKFGDDKSWTLDTYASVTYSIDSKRIDWNNKVMPAIGIKAVKSLNNGIIEVGAQVTNETRFGRIYKSDDRNATGVQGYINYWFGWGH